MKVRAYVKEVNYGYVDLEVEDESEIYDKVWEYGQVEWTKTDADIKDWEKLSD
jgi:hypothetical protein